MKSPDLVEMIENSRDCNNEIRAEGVEEVIAAIKSCDLYREESAEIIKKIGEIKPDESIIYCDISIHDSTLRNYLGNEFCKVIYRDDL